MKSLLARAVLIKPQAHLAFGGKGQLFGFACQTTLVSTVKVEGRKAAATRGQKNWNQSTETELCFKPHLPRRVGWLCYCHMTLERSQLTSDIDRRKRRRGAT